MAKEEIWYVFQDTPNLYLMQINTNKIDYFLMGNRHPLIFQLYLTYCIYFTYIHTVNILG